MSRGERGRRARTIVVAGALAALMSTSAASAQAPGRWSQPVEVLPAQAAKSITNPLTAVSPGGSVVSAFVGLYTPGTSDVSPGTPYMSARLANGRFEQPVRLGDGPGCCPYVNGVATLPGGRAITVWTEERPWSPMYARIREPDGALGPIEPLPLPPDRHEPASAGVRNAVVARPDGSVIVVFLTRRLNGPEDKAWWALRRPDGEWQGPFAFASGERAGSIRLTANAEGGVMAAWGRFRGRLQIRYAPPGEGFTRAESLAGNGIHAAEVALGPAGRAVAVWPRGTSRGQFVSARERSADGTWTRAKRIAPARSYAPGVAMDARGGAIVVYHRKSDERGERSQLRAIVWRGPERGWGRSQLVAREPQLGEWSLPPSIGSTAGGSAVAAWLGKGRRLVAALRPPRSRFGRPTVLSRPRVERWSLAVPPSGEAVAMWTHAFPSPVLSAAYSPRR